MSQLDSTRRLTKEQHHRHSRETNTCSNHQNEKIRSCDFNYIGYRIFLGSSRAACKAFLLQNGITHVLIVGEEIEVEDNLSPEITVNKINIDDDENENVENVFRETCHFIEDGTRGNNRIFVFCYFGVSRSPLVVIEYLHRYMGLKMFNAFHFVATGRPQINLNAGFKRYVIEQAKKENSKIKPEHFSLPGDYRAHPSATVEMNKNYLKDNKARLEKELGTMLKSPKDAKRGDIKVDFSTEEGK